MSTATDIELALWRSRLLRQTLASGALEDACEAAARIVAKIERNREAQCNDLPKVWIPARNEWEMGLTEADGMRRDSELKALRAKLEAALRPFLTPGCVWKHYDAPRGGVARIRDKENRRDVFI